MEGVFTIFLFVGITALTALIFAAWVIATVVRSIVGAIGALFAPPHVATTSTSRATCPNDHCRAPNPAAARFCRRCGSRMPQAQPVQVRRAAA